VDEKKNRSNRRKHGMWFEEAQNVFDDPRGRVVVDRERSDAEDRFMTGLSHAHSRWSLS
jgi:hypothetical protein